MTKAGSLIVAGTQQQQQQQAAAGPLTIPESRGTDRSVGSSPSHGGAALHLASKSVASISPSVSRQPSPPKPGSPGKPPRTPTLVQQRPRAANESADAHAAAQAAQAAAASSDQPASSIALDASSSLADGAAARTARQPSLMPPQHGQGQPQPGSQPGSQPGQPAAARAQQFRTVATGELRITFLNGMMQSIPIVVEQPC
ncbi:hypothetical protein BC831DRAFT_513505 [Entophlyctis helioformis]|nr:hypothetical protein BC831DRAFT_513505 [Entophlyctis helioformis]